MMKYLIFLFLIIPQFAFSQAPFSNTNWTLRANQGQINGVEMRDKFGSNSDIDTGIEEDIWEGGGDYTGFPTGAAETITAVSDNLNDAAAGTGARTIVIEGLNENWEFTTEQLTLNGLTLVTGDTLWRRVNRVKVLTAGSLGANQGVIEIKHSVTVANVFARVPIGTNQSAIACFTIPSGYTGYIVEFLGGVRRSGTNFAEIRMLVREPSGVFRTVKEYGLSSTSIVTATYLTFVELPEMTDFKIRCIDVSANNTDVFTEIDYILVKN